MTSSGGRTTPVVAAASVPAAGDAGGGVLERFGDRLNPMVIKELRQAVRGNAVSGMLCSYLAVMVLVFAREALALEATGFDPRAGLRVFGAIATVMVVTLVIAVPVYAGVRVHVERATEHLRMVQITGIGFPRLFWGKFHAAMLVDVLLLSAMLPFAFAATLLRGIGLPTIAVVAGLTAACSAINVIGMLAVGCLMDGHVSRALWSLFGLTALGSMLVFSGLLAAAVIAADDPGIWLAASCPTCGYALVVVVTLAMLYQGARQRLEGGPFSPVHDRRLTFQEPPRRIDS